MSGKAQTIMWAGFLLIIVRTISSGQWAAIRGVIVKPASTSTPAPKTNPTMTTTPVAPVNLQGGGHITSIG